ncbi:ankyrin repeat domain-containing protein [Ottowia thiooxydans]|uniref:ankyrin repeat domain-containing protein n=1 Tax=Ottowia thiooxydans TaxID=219182 RepID=UPI000406FE8F|nr:ankyrin repeat domain-containing protein [Ottowia thiooxydans]
MRLIYAVSGDPASNFLVSAASAGDLSRVRALLTDDLSVDARDSHYQRTALHVAAEEGHRDVVEFLVASGANLNLLDDTGLTPLMTACSGGRSAVALFLIRSGADVLHLRPGDGMSALKFALWGRCARPVLKELLVRGATPPEDGFKVVHLVDPASRGGALRRWALGLFVIFGFAALLFVFLEIRKATGG